MSLLVQRQEYYYSTVQNEPGEGYRLLSQLADGGINLLAFTAVPMGPHRTQLTLFPEDPNKLTHLAEKAGLTVVGPQHALLVQGDDQVGALAHVHRSLFEVGVNVYAAQCVTSGAGRFGCLLYLRAEDMDRAASALEI